MSGDSGSRAADRPSRGTIKAPAAIRPLGDPMEMKIKFVYERDTKRTYRFHEDSEDPWIGTLYVKKTAFQRRPDAVEVTVKAED